MSALLATGRSLLPDHSVSVVPMIQCRSHGMMNSTLNGVFSMIPALE